MNSESKQHPQLISFEGIDGAGKSTQIRLLEQHLIDMGLKTRVLREPGGTAIGETVRTLLLESKQNTSISPETELLLFAAARAQLTRETVLPLLEAGVIVILERFIDSTLAYQGYGRVMDKVSIRELNRFTTGGLLPIRTFLLDLPVDEAHGRLKRNAAGSDRMEAAGTSFFELVRHGFLDIAKSTPRIHVLDATKSAEDLHQDVLVEMPIICKTIETT